MERLPTSTIELIRLTREGNQEARAMKSLVWSIVIGLKVLITKKRTYFKLAVLLIKGHRQV